MSISAPTIWFDSTTLHALQSYSPVGLSRVEANVLKAALLLEPERTRFCTFDRYRKGMKSVDRGAVSQLLSKFGTIPVNAPVQPKPKSGLRRLGNAVERAVRKSVLASVKQSRVSRESIFAPDDYLFLTGNTWDYFDVPTLTKMVVKDGLRPVVIVNDIIPILFPQLVHSLNERRAFEEYFEFMARHAALLLCISEATRRDFVEFAASRRIVPPPCEVLNCGAEPVIDEPGFPNHLPPCLKSHDFVLSVGAIQVRKNRQMLYQVWRRLSEAKRPHVPKLVIAGGHGWLAKDLVHQIQNDPHTKDSIVVLRHVDDRQLHWLYANCRYTLFPSLYEGWGLPITESLAHGKPCLASNTSSMPEAGQGFAVHLDPYDFRAWYDTIVQWNEHPSILEAESDRIRSRHVPRTWETFGVELREHLRFTSKPASHRNAA